MRPANHNSTKSLVQVAPRVESRQILVAILRTRLESVDDNLIAFTTAEHGGFQIALYDVRKAVAKSSLGSFFARAYLARDVSLSIHSA